MIILNHGIVKIREVEYEKWLLIFHHDSQIAGFFKTKEDAIYSESYNMFSLLSQVSKLQKIDGKYTFIIEYPKEHPNLFLRWSQTNDPLNEIHEYNVVGEAEGFELDQKSNLSTHRFSGLKRYSDSALLGGYRNNKNWYYAVGACNSLYKPNFPGPHESNVSEVFLWVKVTEIPAFLF